MPKPLYNHLPDKLRNRYILARHGFSLANDAKLICSNPSVAIPEEGGPFGKGWGLHENGQSQVQQSAKRLAAHLFPDQISTDKMDVVILCSPFVRTRQTAAIIQRQLNEAANGDKVAEPTALSDLRERWYGQYDMTPDANYQTCWNDDATGPSHGENSIFEVESPSRVADRTTRLIKDQIEAKMKGKTVILVAHGDVCQIMQTAFVGLEAWQHREIDHVETASWREMPTELCE